MNPPRNPNRSTFTSTSSNSTAENLNDASSVSGGGLTNEMTPSTPSLRTSAAAAGTAAYSQYYPLDSSYTGQDDDEDMDQGTTHQLALMRTRSQQSGDQDDIAQAQATQATSQQTSQTTVSSGRRYAPQRQQRQSPVLSQQQRRLPPFSPSVTTTSSTSSQLVRATAGTTTTRGSTSTSLTTTTPGGGGPLDFHKLISVLERRERRLEIETAERLELEKRRFEFTELMEQKRLEVEKARYKTEKERTKRIENILMSLVARAGGTAVTAAMEEIGAPGDTVASDVSS